MSLEFLTPAELYRITRRRRSKAQLKRLRELGYVARPDGDGAPLVLRSHVEAKFGLTSPHASKKAKPDWSILDAKKTASR